MTRARLGTIAIIAVAGVLLSIVPAFAQVPPPQQGPQGRGGRAQQLAAASANPNLTVAEVERMFDDSVLFQAKAQLQLDDQALLAFMARFRQVQQVQRQHQAARQRLLGELNALMRPEVTTDDAALAAKTKALDDLEAQHLQDFGKVMGAVDQVLTVKQRARLRVFMNRMENQKLLLLAQARQQANKTPAPPPGKIIK